MLFAHLYASFEISVSTSLCGKKCISPTQLKDFDALLLLPIFESLKTRKRIEVQARAPFLSDAKNTVKIRVRARGRTRVSKLDFLRNGTALPDLGGYVTASTSRASDKSAEAFGLRLGTWSDCSETTRRL